MNHPFKFQATWLTHEQFQAFVKDSWLPNEPLVSALDKLARDLTSWNKEVFGNIFHQKKHLLARIAGIQTTLSRECNRGLIKLEARLRRELDDILEREEILWYQKSRIEWISNGDRNTSFFHMSTIRRRWRNTITTIKDDSGHWVHDKSQVKHLFVNFFTKLFTEEGESDLKAVPQDIFPEFPQHDWERPLQAVYGVGN